MGVAGRSRSYSAPTPIAPDHRLDTFASTRPALDTWLKTHALDNEGVASRTYVVTLAQGREANRVAAYYTLAYGSVGRTELPRKLRHGLPNPVPVMVLGRLAVDRGHERRGLGSGLLREALRRTLEASQVAGLRALLVHAIDDEAAAFYTQYGFQEFPAGGRTLFLPVETVRASFEG